MDIEIEFPEPPDVAEPDPAKRREQFARWYDRLKTCVVRQFEQVADAIDLKQDKN
jgi:hypothetical protein